MTKATINPITEIASARTASHYQRERWSKARAWWQQILRLSRRPPRRLRLAESLPLGERRFVAVIEFEQSRFLVGGTSASLVLLARLEDDGRGAASPLTNEKVPMSAKEQP